MAALRSLAPKDAKKSGLSVDTPPSTSEALRRLNEETARGQQGVPAEANAAAGTAAPATGFWMFQSQAVAFYLNIRVQVFVAILIAANFMINIIQKQIDPRGKDETGVFGIFELFFNGSFAIELAINMYAFWFWTFWKSGWNVFDFIVVMVSLMFTFKVPLPGPFGLLRMLRAFRVFRLFKRVKSLNKIMVSLAKAVPGVMNAFLIVLIVMCIYAILGVDFWLTYGKDGTFTNVIGNAVELKTSRGQTFGEEYFGNFIKSWYTMFQVLTGESWSEVVARPLLFGNSTFKTIITGFYFISFILIVAVVLINVVVAVLLEKMVDDEGEKDEGKSDEEQDEDQDEDDESVPSLALQGDVFRMREHLCLLRQQVTTILVVIASLEQEDPAMVFAGGTNGLQRLIKGFDDPAQWDDDPAQWDDPGFVWSSSPNPYGDAKVRTRLAASHAAVPEPPVIHEECVPGGVPTSPAWDGFEQRPRIPDMALAPPQPAQQAACSPGSRLSWPPASMQRTRPTPSPPSPTHLGSPGSAPPQPRAPAALAPPAWR